MKNKNAISRRKFICAAATAATAFSIVPRSVLGGRFVPPSDTLYIAGIGVGGKGEGDLLDCAKSPRVKIAFLCDVDDRAAVKSRQNFPDAKYYKDYRKLFDKESKHFDAVTVSTPDHTHAVIAMAAIKRKKHVFVQKPLTWGIGEARALTLAARENKVVTQMGNQGGSGEGVRRAQDIIDAGLIGEVTQIYAWTNRPIWPQGLARPAGEFAVPAELDWDGWLGPAAFTGYNPAYVPFSWRGFTDFGTGALGDMACHVLDPAFRILPINFPNEIECSMSSNWSGFAKEAIYPESFPSSSILYFNFPRTDGKGDIKLTWMDGGLLPKRPQELSAEEPMGDWNGGIIFEGTKGKMMADCYGENPRLLPTSRMKDLAVEKKTPRVPEGHYIQWINACFAGFNKSVLTSPFDYAGPFTESVLLGTVAIKCYMMKGVGGKGFPGRKKLVYNASAMRIDNLPEADQFISRTYRPGFEL